MAEWGRGLLILAGKVVLANRETRRWRGRDSNLYGAFGVK